MEAVRDSITDKNPELVMDSMETICSGGKTALCRKLWISVAWETHALDCLHRTLLPRLNAVFSRLSKSLLRVVSLLSLSSYEDKYIVLTCDIGLTELPGGPTITYK